MRLPCLRVVVLAILSLPLLPVASSQNYDVLIRNGRIVDGSGNPWFYSAVGVTGDRIVFVGKAGPEARAIA